MYELERELGNWQGKLSDRKSTLGISRSELEMQTESVSRRGRQYSLFYTADLWDSQQSSKVLLGAWIAPFEVHALSFERVETISGMTELLVH